MLKKPRVFLSQRMFLFLVLPVWAFVPYALDVDLHHQVAIATNLLGRPPRVRAIHEALDEEIASYFAKDMNRLMGSQTRGDQICRKASIRRGLQRVMPGLLETGNSLAGILHAFIIDRENQLVSEIIDFVLDDLSEVSALPPGVASFRALVTAEVVSRVHGLAVAAPEHFDAATVEARMDRSVYGILREIVLMRSEPIVSLDQIIRMMELSGISDLTGLSDES